MRKAASLISKAPFWISMLGLFWPFVLSSQTMQGLMVHKQEFGIWTSAEIIFPDGSRIYRAMTSQRGELYTDAFEIRTIYINFTAENCDIYTLEAASSFYTYQRTRLKIPFESFNGSNIGAIQINDNEPIGFINTGSFMTGDESMWFKYELAKPQAFLAQIVKGETVNFLHKGANKIDRYSLLGASQAIKRAYRQCLENK